MFCEFVPEAVVISVLYKKLINFRRPTIADGRYYANFRRANKS
jgi:hypothetical protein